MDPPCDFSSSDFVWAQHWKSKQRTQKLQTIASLVHRYGGTVQVDIETNTLAIDVPEEHKVECALKVQEEMEKMGCECVD